MTRAISALVWGQTAGAGRIASYVIDAGIDTVWTIKLNGTDETGTPYQVQYVVIDNMSNNAFLTFAYGPLLLRVAPYTRKSFPITLDTSDCIFNITAGTALIFFATYDPRIPDDVNNVSTSSAGFTVQYTWISIPANGGISAMTADHQNKFLSFESVPGQAFSLLPAVTAGNGWFNPMVVNPKGAVSSVSIFPQAGETLQVGNTNYTSGSPLVLAVGQSLVLSCDGGLWRGSLYQ